MSHTAEEYRNRGDSIQTALDESYVDQLAIVIVWAKEAREVVAMLREAAEMREVAEIFLRKWDAAGVDRSCEPKLLDAAARFANCARSILGGDHED